MIRSKRIISSVCCIVRILDVAVFSACAEMFPTVRRTMRFAAGFLCVCRDVSL